MKKKLSGIPSSLSEIFNSFLLNLDIRSAEIFFYV